MKIKPLTLFFIASFLLLAIFQTPSFGMHPSTTICKLDSSLFLRELINKDFPDTRIYDVYVLAFNDVSCGEAEQSANIAVNFLAPPNSRFGIFKIYFFQNGKLKSSTEISAWGRLKNWEDWKTPWCTFIKENYPNELEIQNCN